MPILITLITSSCVTIYILQRLSVMALKVLQFIFLITQQKPTKFPILNMKLHVIRASLPREVLEKMIYIITRK